MNKHLWITIIFSCFLLIGGWIFINTIIIDDNTVFNNKVYLVTVKGAVFKKVESWVPQGTKVSSVIYRSHLLLNADVSKIDINKIIKKDEDIYVPYKEGTEPKIDATDGLTKAEIDQLGVSKSLGNALFKLFKEKNNYVTWDDIDELPGTGEITMARLKRLLIIRNFYF